MKIFKCSSPSCRPSTCRALHAGHADFEGRRGFTYSDLGRVARASSKAKAYSHMQTYHHVEFPPLGVYSKFVEATTCYSVELRTLLALRLHRNRQTQGAYPIVLQDSTAVAVYPMARASQHRTFWPWARKSKNG